MAVAKPVKDRYWRLRREGFNMAQAAREVGIAYATAKGWERGLRDSSGDAWREEREGRSVPDGPVPRDELGVEASRALGDFEFFRRRYFGHVSSPWQTRAAHLMVELLASPDKEFVVVNCPPGVGKTTLFTHDVPAWLTCRDRSIRGIIGSRTFRQAEMHAARLRRSLERVTPAQAKDEERVRGLAVDAAATLSSEFGRFKPNSDEIWQRGQYTVLQRGDTPIDEKESTWTAFGQDSGSLGWRVNYITWDDVVDKTTIRTVEAIERQQEWWDDEAETRLEPGGVLVLPGQRLSASDLYRYNLDKVLGAEDDVEEIDLEREVRPHKYQHIVYPGHFDDRCVNVHRPSEAMPWPDGCLLDPVRLPWRELRAHRANNRKYRTVYLQEDVDEASVLVPKIWVDGGRGVGGEDFPGCWDEDRGVGEIPRGLSKPWMSIVTADPSPTRFWSIQWWLFHPASEQRFLLDLVRQVMDAPDFLDWDQNTGKFTGLLDEWWQRSVDVGAPITQVIAEANAAQRFILQYDHVRRWQALRKVSVIPHQTHRNKSDADFGVQTIAPHYRFGRVRLPGRQGDGSRLTSLKLVDEVTRWPEGSTDDCVMAHWFLEWNLPRLARPGAPRGRPSRRPSWARPQPVG